ncbi:MAG: MBL fold metallo-hydrolase [Phenylobacterium sp.]|jgi:glyoxylase-like metal-dependent hydrolase (beta-lactamase superfamily II)|uniref:MBL fold metallo-hydrolase n=1 Tax=Phenylobacterium sp. TaxID=1871053 RepID=UPI00391FBB17
MRDGFEDPVQEAHKAKITYPFPGGPEQGEAVDVAPGVKWLRMPLGGSLAWINVWAIREAGGWAIVDTGLGGQATRESWRKALAGPLEGLPVTRVFVTHMHPDHIGMSGWMTRKFGCRLWITRLEFLMCRSLSADTGREAPDDALTFYRAAGWDEEALEDYRARFGGFGKSLHALPDSFQRLSDGDVIRIGDHDWKVVVGSGHSPEHACLWCPDLKLMISGDQVLPKITSNVSVFPTEPAGDPLTDWLTSLARIRGIVPDDVLVLPAHNEPFHGLHARIDHLIGGHERSLTRLHKLLEEPKRAIDTFHILFRRKIDRWTLGMATGESLAHLNCLMTRGLAVRSQDEAGVDWYRAV